MTAALFTTCALPGCPVPVVTPGDVCDGCLAAFGPMLRPADSDTDPDVIAAELAARDAYVRAAYAGQRAR